MTDIGFPILDAGSTRPVAMMRFSTMGVPIALRTRALIWTLVLLQRATVRRSYSMPYLPEFGPGGVQLRDSDAAKETAGVLRFRTYLAAFSDDANFSYVVFGHADWSLDIGGTIDWFATDTGGAKWIKGSAKIGVDTKLTEIDHGKEANEAGCEVRPPIALPCLAP